MMDLASDLGIVDFVVLYSIQNLTRIRTTFFFSQTSYLYIDNKNDIRQYLNIFRYISSLLKKIKRTRFFTVRRITPTLWPSLQRFPAPDWRPTLCAIYSNLPLLRFFRPPPPLAPSLFFFLIRSPPLPITRRRLTSRQSFPQDRLHRHPLLP